MQPGQPQQMNHAKQGSEARQRPSEPCYLAVAQIVRPFGLRGELKAHVLTDYPEQLSRLSVVYVGLQEQAWGLESVRLHQGFAIFKLAGCDSREAAEELRGALVQVALQDAVPLEEGEFYEHQIIGMTVIEQDGSVLGQLSEILVTGANDVYIVRGPQGELLLPAIQEVILDIDPDLNQMTVHLLPGLR